MLRGWAGLNKKTITHLGTSRFSQLTDHRQLISGFESGCSANKTCRNDREGDVRIPPLKVLDLGALGISTLSMNFLGFGYIPRRYSLEQRLVV
jgi:hypothetical protein